MGIADNYAPDRPEDMSDDSVNAFLDRPQVQAAPPTAAPQPIDPRLQPNFQRLMTGQQTVAPPTSSELYNAGQLPGQQGPPRQVTPWSPNMAADSNGAPQPRPQQLAPGPPPPQHQSMLGRLLSPAPTYVPPAPSPPQLPSSTDPWYRLGQKIRGV